MPTEASERELLRLVGVLLLGAMAALLDTTIVSIAYDDLTRAFRAGVSQVQWVGTAYLLAMVAVIPAMGYLSERFGTRRLWLATLSLFLTGSVLCSMAWSIESLIAFRVVQGLGAGLILPLVLAILAAEAGPRRVGRAMGLVGIPGQLAPMLGPVAGGVIVASLGWRWIFLVNVPIGVTAILLAHRHLHPNSTRTDTRLDRRGLALLIPAVILLMAGLSIADQQWTMSAGLAAIGAVLVVAFIGHARAQGEKALVDLTLLRKGSFAIAALLVFLSGACLYGPMLLMPLFFQRARGFEVDQVGWLLAPQGLGLMLALWFAGRWADRSGPRIVATLGAAALVGGLALFAWFDEAPTGVLGCALFVMGAGFGGIGAGTSTASYRDVAKDRIPRAASLLSVVQRIGASLGTVVAALILGATGTTFGPAFTAILVLTVAVLVVTRFLPSSPVEKRE
ncbi:DHA2 family efflux MFS transporter permease subunit [Kineosporia babensis]|uniref:DHA2 family efflux MFS transporter permease subunit n=1 Tax=Kineosporia babensis TaxID=499548 RepID=A0A9X1SU21_9ACTN|nr:DHA2 family efflux MFS transporter permease subunit [Kineosporia babensis]MCD5311951.1 DHA2 family efflux MFS transporter permease subunit [Kineosporia babensis]